MKLDAWTSRPLNSVHSKSRAQQSLCRCHVFLEWHADHHQERVGEEDQLTTWTQQARGLGNPALWIRPQASAVFRNREIEARVRVSDLFSVAVNERKVESVLSL
jgi:hypothetical protein